MEGQHVKEQMRGIAGLGCLQVLSADILLVPGLDLFRRVLETTDEIAKECSIVCRKVWDRRGRSLLADGECALLH